MIVVFWGCFNHRFGAPKKREPAIRYVIRIAREWLRLSAFGVGIIGAIIAGRVTSTPASIRKKSNPRRNDMKHMPDELQTSANRRHHGKNDSGKDFLGRLFRRTRIRCLEGHVSIPNQDTEFHIGDQLSSYVPRKMPAVTALSVRKPDWKTGYLPVSTPYLVTKSNHSDENRKHVLPVCAVKRNHQPYMRSII